MLNSHILSHLANQFNYLHNNWMEGGVYKAINVNCVNSVNSLRNAKSFIYKRVLIESQCEGISLQKMRFGVA